MLMLMGTFTLGLGRMRSLRQNWSDACAVGARAGHVDVDVAVVCSWA